MCRSISLWFCFLLCISCSRQDSTNSFSTPVRTIITGQVINLSCEHPTIGLAINRIAFGQETLRTSVDSAGQFKFEFLTYVPTDAWVTYPINFQVLFQPGDSLHVVLDAQHKDRPTLLNNIQFEGAGAETNRQAARFQQRYYSSDLYFYGPGHEKANRRLQNAFKNYQPDQFKVFADSIKSEGTALLNHFIKEDKPDESVHIWATRLMDRNYFDILSFYPGEHRNMNNLDESAWSIPLSYYDYFKYPVEVSESIPCGDAINDYLNRYSSYLSKQALRRLESPETNSGTTSSLDFDSTKLNLIMSSVPPGLFRETMITYTFNQWVEYARMESFERYQSIAEANIHHEFLKEPLMTRYRSAKERIARVDSVNFLRVKTLDNFLSGIIANNKGHQVTYVDIWASWCGPCRAEFPYSKKLQAEFADQVDFVFVCIDSDEGSYINTLKEFQLTGTHYFLNKSQSKIFQQELQLEGVPQYLVINKNGKIVSSGFEYRPSEVLTKETIKTLIKS